MKLTVEGLEKERDFYFGELSTCAIQIITWVLVVVMTMWVLMMVVMTRVGPSGGGDDHVVGRCDMVKTIFFYFFDKILIEVTPLKNVYNWVFIVTSTIFCEFDASYNKNPLVNIF